MAEGSSTGKCCIYTRKAVQAGLGLADKPSGIESAKNLGGWLIGLGFKAVNPTAYKNGDVAIFDAIGTHTHGHSAIYNNGKWHSDFTQKGFYPYADGSKPSFTIYRYQ